MPDKIVKYSLKITPAIPPEKRHMIQDTLKVLGFEVIGGGTDTDLSQCDVSFEGLSFEELGK